MLCRLWQRKDVGSNCQQRQWAAQMPPIFNGDEMLTLTADNLPRFMQCNGYRLLEPDPAFLERDNTIREEGTAAHWLAQTVFNGQHTCEEMIDRKAPNGVYITAEMSEHVQDYLSCIDRTSGHRGDMEWSYSLVGQGWQINGRADFIEDAHGFTLNVDDFKYGYGIVEPERNWTLISHAMGYCITRNVQPQQITFTIHQPRAPHRDGRVRQWTISYMELVYWYEQLRLALENPSDMLQTGPHCYKCPAAVGCPARQDAEMNAIEVSRLAYRAEIDNADISERMALIHRAEEMLKQAKKAYEEQIMFRLKQGQAINGFAVENDYTNRMWKDGVTVEFMQALTGVNLSKPQLITPRQAENAGISKDIVALYADRRPKGSKLVRANANKRATKFFGAK